MLKNNKRWEWFVECQRVFKKLIKIMMFYLVLKLLCFDRSFKVHINASKKAISRILIQVGHLVAFKSRKLNKIKKKILDTWNEKEDHDSALSWYVKGVFVRDKIYSKDRQHNKHFFQHLKEVVIATSSVERILDRV